MELKKIPLTFITGNKGKLEEFMSIMGEELSSHYTIGNVNFDRIISYMLK